MNTPRALRPDLPLTSFRPVLWAAMAALLPLPALAHPHIFVDASHELIFDDQGRLEAVRARWDYDEMFTLLMVEDGGYDTNKDGAISGDELTGFQQWDADWPEDYAGDMVVEIGGQKIPLERPSDWAAEWHDGRAVSIHTRPLADPVEVAGAASPQILIRAYDPDYYVAYTITAEPEFTGREDCKAQVFEPDIDAIPDELREAIAELSADTTPEAAGLTGAGLSAVGEMYAEEVHATCGG